MLRLRAQQERAADTQSQIDELRARRCGPRCGGRRQLHCPLIQTQHRCQGGAAFPGCRGDRVTRLQRRSCSQAMLAGFVHHRFLGLDDSILSTTWNTVVVLGEVCIREWCKAASCRYQIAAEKEVAACEQASRDKKESMLR